MALTSQEGARTLSQGCGASRVPAGLRSTRTGPHTGYTGCASTRSFSAWWILNCCDVAGAGGAGGSPRRGLLCSLKPSPGIALRTGSAGTFHFVSGTLRCFLGDLTFLRLLPWRTQNFTSGRDLSNN